MSQAHPYRYSELKVGDAVEFGKTVTDADIIMFAAASGDQNPLHINEEYAKTTRFGKRIAHGALSSAMVSTALTHAFGNGLYMSQYSEFKLPVYIGDSLRAVVTCKEKQERNCVVMDTKVYNQKGELVLDGEAMMRLANE